MVLQKGTAISTVDNVMQRYPLPPKKGAKKEEKKKEPVVEEPKVPETLSCEKALNMATSWKNASQIGSKYAVGTLTTAKYQEKVAVFDQMNSKAKDHSALYP